MAALFISCLPPAFSPFFSPAISPSFHSAISFFISLCLLSHHFYIQLVSFFLPPSLACIFFFKMTTQKRYKLLLNFFVIKTFCFVTFVFPSSVLRFSPYNFVLFHPLSTSSLYLFSKKPHTPQQKKRYKPPPNSLIFNIGLYLACIFFIKVLHLFTKKDTSHPIIH